MKRVLELVEDLLLVDPSFFDSFHFSSKYKGGGAAAELSMLLHVGVDIAEETIENRGK